MPKRIRFFSTMFAVFAGVLLTASLVVAPEGFFRSGDFLPLCGGWLLLLIMGGCSFRLKNAASADLFLGGGLLWGLISAMALAVTGFGNLLFALNVSVLLLGFGAAYAIFRFGDARLRSILFTTLLAVALAESVFALYCYRVKDPAIRAAYRANPEQTLAENGLYFAPNSTERLLFERRLLDSTEPLGTYGLTNTLAGTLVPPLVMLIGLFFLHLHRLFFAETDPAARKKRLGKLAAAFLPILPLLAALTLTKSRAGYLACLAGGIFAVLAGVRTLTLEAKARLAAKAEVIPEENLGANSQRGLSSRRLTRLALLLIPTLFLLCAVGAWRVGILDREVFSEAKKSLGFRLDYWTATAHMIADRPIFGVGPGNFQAVYPAYMLETASESVADPHNFAFELAAVFGLPTLTFFLLWGIALLVPRKKSRCETTAPVEQCAENRVEQRAEIPVKNQAKKLAENQAKNQAENPTKARFSPLEALAASVLGFLFVFGFSLTTEAPIDFDFLLGAIPAALVAAVIGKALFAEETVPPPLLLAALGASLINLSAAGGILFPATALPILLCGAAALAESNRSRADANWASTLDAKRESPHYRKNRLRGFAPIALAGVLLGLIFFGAQRLHHWEKTTLENMDTQIAGHATPTALLAELQKETGETGYRALSIPISRRLFSLALSEYERDSSAGNQTAWQNARRDLLRAAPQSSPVRFDAGREEYDVWKGTGRREFLIAAEEDFAEAVLRAPTDASLRVWHGRTLTELGQRAEAQKEFAEALRLDAVTPHADRKLPPELRKIAQ